MAAWSPERKAAFSRQRAEMYARKRAEKANGTAVKPSSTITVIDEAVSIVRRLCADNIERMEKARDSAILQELIGISYDSMKAKALSVGNANDNGASRMSALSEVA